MSEHLKNIMRMYPSVTSTGNNVQVYVACHNGTTLETQAEPEMPDNCSVSWYLVYPSVKFIFLEFGCSHQISGVVG